MKKLFFDILFPEPDPCPVCGETRIQTWFVSGYYGKFLPFWVEMRCPRCGRGTKPKLFRFRAVHTWNQEAEIPKNCRECACAKGCKSWYGGLFCKYKGAMEGRVRV